MLQIQTVLLNKGILWHLFISKDFIAPTGSCAADEISSEHLPFSFPLLLGEQTGVAAEDLTCLNQDRMPS